MAPKAKIAVENVNKPGRTVSVDAYKYLAMKAAMFAALPASALGLTLVELRDRVVPRLQGAAELGHAIGRDATGLVDPKHRVLVAVEGDRLAVGLEIACSRLAAIPEAQYRSPDVRSSGRDIAEPGRNTTV
jgi:hypothetical protein